MAVSENSVPDLHQSVQMLAEHLYSLSGIHVGIHDIERMYTVSAGDECMNLCKYCKQNCPSFLQKCTCNDEEYLTLAYRTGRKVIYRCHFGMTEVILPVKTDQQFLGVLFLGQVRVIPDDTMTFEKIYTRLAAEYPDSIYDETKDALFSVYQNTAVITQDKLDSLVGLAELAVIGTHVDRWLDHSRQTTETIVRQYLEYLDIVHLPLSELSVASIAQRLNISYSQLNRISISIYGQSLKQYILDVKIKAAAVLLKEQPTMRVRDAAVRVGISNFQYFSKLFQRRMGCSCTEYRRIKQTQ